MLFRLKTYVRRSLNRFFMFDRPVSFPFISGDGFRALAQHYFDEISDLNSANVEENNIVFVRSDFLKDFFAKKHPQIKYPYILISHNDDTNIDESYTKFIDKKIIHWFAQNLLFKHPQVTPIPIGLENLRYNHKGKLDYFNQDGFKKENDTVIKYNFSVRSNKIRIIAQDNLEKTTLAEKINPKDQDDYVQEIKRSYFVASPDGRGVDCHRTWEAVYLKAIPIVTNNPMTEYFKEIGLPIALIDSWTKINELTKDNLKNIYSDTLKDEIPRCAYMGYWQDKILSYRKK